MPIVGSQKINYYGWTGVRFRVSLINADSSEHLCTLCGWKTLLSKQPFWPPYRAFSKIAQFVLAVNNETSYIVCDRDVSARTSETFVLECSEKVK